MRAAVAAVVLGVGLVTGCARRPETPLFTGEPYLIVWAGDADRQNSDFLAVIDADFTSPSYGKVLKTYPVRSRGNEPNALNAMQRPDRRIFATGLLTNRTFIFDLRQPLAGRLLHVDEPGPDRKIWAPQEVVSLPNGHAVVACSDPARYRGEPREVVTAAGGLLELGADGQPVREVSAADPGARGVLFAPTGAALVPSLNRVVTTSAAHGYTATNRGERMPGISVQVWNLPELGLVKTVALESGPRGEENLGPITARAFHQGPFVYVNTDVGSALFTSDSVGTSDPIFRLVFDFGAGAIGGGAAITPDDRYYVAALSGLNRVASLDLSDPWKPKPVTSVRLDRDPIGGAARKGGPHGLAMSADGTRIAVADYTADVPGFFQDGDHRVYMVRLDRTNGRLRIDGAFVDELTGEVGVDFNRTKWPHGETGEARPKGLLFVTAEPPPAKE